MIVVHRHHSQTAIIQTAPTREDINIIAPKLSAGININSIDMDMEMETSAQASPDVGGGDRGGHPHPQSQSPCTVNNNGVNGGTNGMATTNQHEQQLHYQQLQYQQLQHQQLQHQQLQHQQQQQQHQEGGEDDPAPAPKRPLSAYNFFFKSERTRLLDIAENGAAIANEQAAADDTFLCPDVT
jgi:hypothetical protein